MDRLKKMPFLFTRNGIFRKEILRGNNYRCFRAEGKLTYLFSVGDQIIDHGRIGQG